MVKVCEKHKNTYLPKFQEIVLEGYDPEKPEETQCTVCASIYWGEHDY